MSFWKKIEIQLIFILNTAENILKKEKIENEWTEILYKFLCT